MNRLDQYLVFGLLIIFSFHLLPTGLFQQQLLHHIQAIQQANSSHHCEFDQLLCNSQLINHACDHKGHFAAKSNSKQLVYVQYQSAATLNTTEVQVQHQKIGQILPKHLNGHSIQFIESNFLRGPPEPLI